MDTTTNKSVTRVTADFSPEAYETLSSVSNQLDASKAEVLRKALGLLNFVVKHRAQGWRLVLEKDDARKEIVTL